jgi:hypothetical protein
MYQRYINEPRRVVESTRKNNGSKPVLRKLTARIHTSRL